MSLTYPSVTIQSYLAFTAKRWGQFPTISFTNGATAGSEVVSVDSSLNITVQIESGVSTMLQIKTAVDATAGTGAGLNAGDLVSVAVTSGHNSDAVITVDGAALAGGTALAAASKTIGHLVYTAVTAGAAGNNIRIKYTSGATLTVSVSTNDITVRIRNDGTTTNALIKAAVAASGAAAALVTCASDGLSLAYKPMTNAAPAFTALAGGTDAVAPSVILQDLTFASDKTGVSDNGKTITYTTGATAGSEVVTVDASGNASIQIQNGTSTATQIKSACDASASMNGVAASGTLTVTSFAAMHLTAATPSGTITFGTPSNGDTVVFTGLPTDGTKTFTKAASASGNNFAVIADLTALIQALTDLNASDDGTTITITVATKGAAMNAATITGTGSFSTLSRTFSGGINAATINVNGTTLVESTDFNAASSNNTTATNIAAAIDALAAVASSALAAVVTVTADAVSSAGNSYVFTKTGGGSTISGSGTLSGGVDGYNVTISGTGSTAQKTVNAATMSGAVAATQPASPNDPPLRVKIIS